MQQRIALRCNSSKAWLDTVLNDFNSFLQDHADCERKASAMAMSFVAKYPNRIEIIPELIDIGVEELEHFRSVCEILLRRKVALPHRITKDQYVSDLIRRAHSGREERFLDRLLIASIVETRGAERFRMISEGLENKEMSKFYKDLWISEARHGEVFVRMAKIYFNEKEVFDRLDWWGDMEAKILQALPLAPALH